MLLYLCGTTLEYNDPRRQPTPASPTTNLPLYIKKGVMLSKTQTHQQLPVIHLGAPHRKSFPLVKDVFYTNDTSELVSYMLPLVPCAGSLSSVTSTAVNPDTDSAMKVSVYQEWKRDVSDRYATAIAEHLQPSFILQHIARVYLPHHNVVALGPSDERIWEYIDMCWENLSITIARANGREIEIESGYKE